MTNKFIPLLVFLALVTTVMSYGVMAAWATGQPTAYSNISSATAVFNCTFVDGALVTTPDTTNSSMYWKGSGSWVAIPFDTCAITALGNSSCWATVTLTSLTEATAALNCTLANETARNSSVPTITITLDRTSPSATMTTDIDSAGSGRIVLYSSSVADSLSGLKSSSCNVTDPDNTVHTLSTSALNTPYEFDRMVSNGDWTFTCVAADHAGNTKTVSKVVTTHPTGAALTTSGQPANGSQNGLNLNTIFLIAIVGIVVYAIANKK